MLIVYTLIREMWPLITWKEAEEKQFLKERKKKKNQ